MIFYTLNLFVLSVNFVRQLSQFCSDVLDNKESIQENDNPEKSVPF